MACRERARPKILTIEIIEAMTITATAFWLEGVGDFRRAAGVGVP